MSYRRHPVRHQILGGKICVDEHEDRTGATARLHRRDRKLLGVGQTRLDPGDQFPDTLAAQQRSRADTSAHATARRLPGGQSGSVGPMRGLLIDG